jgi:nucleoid-associated protein YgaU
MKTTIIALICTALFVAVLPAQSLANNEYYQRSLQLKNMAATAYDAGDYDAAVRYAAQSKEFAELSDRFVATMLARRDADRALKAAETKLAWAVRVDGDRWYPAEMARSRTYLESAQLSFQAEDYRTANSQAVTALDALATVEDQGPRIAALRRQAENALGTARARLAWATGVDGDRWYPSEMANARALLEEADIRFKAEDYPLAKMRADEAFTALATVEDQSPRIAAQKREAESAIAAAEERFNWAKGIAADKRYPTEFTAAAALLETAKSAFSKEDYEYARISANDVLIRLAGVKDTIPLPALFVVRELPKDTDCFWRIAALPAIYNDPFQWPRLYEANKNKLPDPKNPDLVRPGTILTIPSLRGEYREGTWTPDGRYPELGK